MCSSAYQFPICFAHAGEGEPTQFIPGSNQRLFRSTPKPTWVASPGQGGGVTSTMQGGIKPTELVHTLPPIKNFNNVPFQISWPVCGWPRARWSFISSFKKNSLLADKNGQRFSFDTGKWKQMFWQRIYARLGELEHLFPEIARKQ